MDRAAIQKTADGRGFFPEVILSERWGSVAPSVLNHFLMSKTRTWYLVFLWNFIPACRCLEHVEVFRSKESVRSFVGIKSNRFRVPLNL